MAAPPLEIPDLVACLRALLAQVPRGKVTTYGGLAEALGNRIAARWVGQFAMHHDHADDCLCHRIVRADGSLGTYIAGTPTAKARRLRADGVEVRGGRVALDPCRFDRFVGPRPLARLREVQESLPRRTKLCRRRRIPDRVGGIDVSYAGPSEGVAAYALVETETGELVFSTSVRRAIEFPYISTYLAFRELPIHLELIQRVRARRQLADVVLVDGSGVLHQRHAGIATHLGVVADLATVGVTKKLLCGQVDVDGMEPSQSRPVFLGDRRLGVALRPTTGSRRPIFVSPGHRVDVGFCEDLTRRLLFGRRLPEPLYWADRLSRTEASRR